MNRVRWMSAAAGTALVAATFALPGAVVAYASGNGSVTGNGDVSLLSGNTVNAPISAPLNLCGISIGLLGFANSGCEGGASSSLSGEGGDSQNGNVTGNGNVSTGSGNTVNAPVSAPVNVCGVAVAGLGLSNAECKGGSSSCIGETCTPPTCQGEKCTPPPCEENTCHTPPPCEENTCNTPPPCQGNCNTPPPCQGNCNTLAPCQGNCNTPPPCQGNCTPPTTPPSSVGTTTVTAATMPSGSLPTTGADLLLLGVAALGTIGAGAGTVALARRRRNGETS
jgi:hypothetical protein